MKYIFTYLFLFSVLNCFSQTSTENYTKTISPKIALSITELEDLLGNNNSNTPNILNLDYPVSSGTFIANSEINLLDGFDATGLAPNEEVTIQINGSGIHADLFESLVYTDGLDRPSQTIAKGQSPNGNDIITFFEYDEFGRTSKIYLPYSSLQNTGNFIDDPTAQQSSYYQSNYGDTYSYSENRFDGSPLNQLQEVSAPGGDLQIIPNSDSDHTQKFEYGTNVSNTEIRKFIVDDSGSSVVVNSSHYDSTQLFKRISKNENWQPTDGKLNTVETYSDKNDRVITEIKYEQSQTGITGHITQNVFDAHGRLRFVLPPPMMVVIKNSQGNFTFDTTTIEQYKNLIYQYEYDDYNRKIAQRIPNRAWEYYVYDHLDRPIFTRDANLELISKWFFTKYDVFDRFLYSGIYFNINHVSRESLQAAVDAYIATNSNNSSNSEKKTTNTISIGGINLNYTNNAFPIGNIEEVLSVNYYDDYSFTDSDKPVTPTTIEGQPVTTKTKGLLTAAFSKTINQSSTSTQSTWTKVYNYYDNKARRIKLYNKNWLGGYTTTDRKLDFRGRTDFSVTKHKLNASSTELVINDRFVRDHSERELGHFQKINNFEEERISENSYDELGMLINKKVGGKSSTNQALQELNYKYNIKGQFLELNDVDNLGSDLFAYRLKYNETKEGHTSRTETPQYNGNISQNIWKSAFNNMKRSYLYDYDKLNRLRNSYYEEAGNISLTENSFSIALTYDNNGNIKTLKRFGDFHIEDDLVYSYQQSGNQLLSVTDNAYYGNTLGLFKNDNTTGNDYLHNAFNGALQRDLNKGIFNISYNELDQPRKIDFSQAPDILFTYSSNGEKLRKLHNITGNSQRTDYLGGFNYLNGELQFFRTPEGFVTNSGSGFQHVYIYSDHLGNNRVAYSDIDNDNILESNELLSSRDYYPFGGLMYNNQGFVDSYVSGFNYLYQNKEFNKENNLNWHDFGSRNYDASLGRWVVPDPQNQYASPYLAMGNNPVLLTDPDGEFAIAAVIIGAVAGGIVGGIQADQNGFSVGEGIFAGAVIGGLGGGYGQIVPAVPGLLGGTITGAVNGFSGSFVSSFGNSLLSGNDYNSSISSALDSGRDGAIVGGLLGGVQGVRKSISKGRNPITGNSQGIKDARNDPTARIIRDPKAILFPTYGVQRVYAEYDFDQWILDGQNEFGRSKVFLGHTSDEILKFRLLDLAQDAQVVGNGASWLGYGFTLVGQPEIGVPLYAGGSTLETAGEFGELYLNQDWSGMSEKAIETAKQELAKDLFLKTMIKIVPKPLRPVYTPILDQTIDKTFETWDSLEGIYYKY